MNLKFSHKILLAASGVVVLAFALFTLYNDYLQRSTIKQNLESSIQQSGELTASSVQNWLSGRILVLESLTQNVAHQGSAADLPGWSINRRSPRTSSSPTLVKPTACSPSVPTQRCLTATTLVSVPGTSKRWLPISPC